MTAWSAYLALAACAVVGCGAPGPAVTRVQAEPEPTQCQNYRLPMYFLFPCRDAEFDQEFATNWERFRGVLQMLRTRRGLRRLILHGRISTSYDAELGHRELARRRAASVAEALVRAGVPRALIEVDEHPEELTSAYSEPDPCPPRAEDRFGDRRRSVHLNAIICEAPGERPAGWSP